MESTDKKQTVRCSLCGTEFTPSDHLCGGCVVRRECRLVCCPNCGFGMPEESKLAGWLRNRMKKKEKD